MRMWAMERSLLSGSHHQDPCELRVPLAQTERGRPWLRDRCLFGSMGTYKWELTEWPVRQIEFGVKVNTVNVCVGAVKSTS